jgi:hypothetical protein
VLVPIATVRGDVALLKRAADWYATLSGPMPDSPYARVMRPSQDLAFAEAGLMEPISLEVEPRIASYQEQLGGPTWTAALDLVFRSWIDEGNLAGAARIVAAMTDAQARYTAVRPMGLGTVDLIRGRLALAQGELAVASEAAQSALEHYRRIRAPWWIAKAIRLKLRAGAMDAGLEQEVTEIERQLGAVAPTA